MPVDRSLTPVRGTLHCSCANGRKRALSCRSGTLSDPLARTLAQRIEMVEAAWTLWATDVVAYHEFTDLLAADMLLRARSPESGGLPLGEEDWRGLLSVVLKYGDA